MKPKRRNAGVTRCPEAEKAFLAGMLELLQDALPRCRAALSLVDPASLTIEAGPELLAAITEAADLEAPTLADVLRIARHRGGDDATDERSLLADLAAASVRSPRGYALAVNRNAAEIMRAATRRHTIDAATVAADVAADPQAKPAEIEAAAAAVAAASTSAGTARLDWQPFPVELLPEPVCSFVRQVWASLDRSADPACAALPLLASVAAAIGNKRRIEIRPGWTEPSVLWCAIVAESGSKKSPAADKSLSFVRERQTAAFEAHKIALAAWEEERRAYEASRRSKAADAEPPSPKPIATRFIVNDITVESLAVTLEHSPNVLLDRDEISGWVSSFDRYASGKSGGDVAQWLPCYNAAPWVVDRKTSGTIHIPRAAVSVFGGIQPKVLIRSFGPHVDNGLLQRFMLAAPPEGPQQWPDGDVDFATMAAMQALFDTLFSLRPDDDGLPKVLDLEPDALGVFKEWWSEIGQQRQQATGPTKSMLSKAEAWAARLGLVCHLIRQAGAEPALRSRIDADSITRGVGLARWAAREWTRAFRLMEQGGDDAADARLREWIMSRGGTASVRDVRRGLRRYQAPGLAEEGLRRLVASGAAAWTADSTGGRPADGVRVK
jgi:hypothetical protein